MLTDRFLCVTIITRTVGEVKIMTEKLKNIIKSREFIAFSVVFLVLALLSVAFVSITNAVVLLSTKDNIVNADDAAKLSDVDCILVLGCGLKKDGNPSDMLTDRLMIGTSLYKNRASQRLLMSGDHGRTEYDEVNAMKNFAVEVGISSADIFMDHAGFSTYESVYRSKEVFGADKIIIVIPNNIYFFFKNASHYSTSIHTI